MVQALAADRLDGAAIEAAEGALQADVDRYVEELTAERERLSGVIFGARLYSPATLAEMGLTAH